MGYDHYVCNEDGKCQTDELKTNYQDDLYLRRGIGSQGALRDALEDAGMGYWAVAYSEDMPWPRPPVGADGKPDYDDPGFERELEHRLKHSFDERPGIPLHKLVMNEGWWVTRIECATALELWERNGQPMPDDFRDDVIPFLRQAAKHGGFRTY
jgi:hypothetical protein